MINPTCTGLKDKNGKLLYIGDVVRYNLEGTHTKKEYWNPEYEIIWRAPSFGLKHVGGGIDGGSHDFKLRYGGSNGDLELIHENLIAREIHVFEKNENISSLLAYPDEKTTFWKIEEYKIWNGINKEKPVWAALSYVSDNWDDMMDLCDYLRGNNPDIIVRVMKSDWVE